MRIQRFVIFTGDMHRGIEPYDTTSYEVKIPAGGTEALSAEEKEKYGNRNMYELTFSNKGGLGNADHY